MLNLTLVEMWSLGFNVLIRGCILLALISVTSGLEPELGSTRVVFQVFYMKICIKFSLFIYNCSNLSKSSKLEPCFIHAECFIGGCHCIYLCSVKSLSD